ncbi:putative transcription initiation factor TFIID [Blumeria hordei DH14]|uniref:Putative transcription initiation factor TFIID n=1 Tax=Blumeria graminis f. sp. hordei (strain DH14) TaxID=546991 RepID=N1JFD5_BLUG1|nr:putative transcription initiation factor TFIID [Blumeria hordei DH14]
MVIEILLLSSPTNLTNQVIEYLVKKGYNRTEQMLRHESSRLDKEGRPIQDRVEDLGHLKYRRAFEMLLNWIDSNLDIYKLELNRLPWPIFVYSYLSLVKDEATVERDIFFNHFSSSFERFHADELQEFSLVTLPAHIEANATTELYLKNKYKLPLNQHAYYSLITFLESSGKSGGTVILGLLQTYFEIRETTRGLIDRFSFEAIINNVKSEDNDAEDLEEGIPGAFTGVTNKDISNNNAILKLGMMPMEPELISDVRTELEEEDMKNPPDTGKRSLVEEFDTNMKREEGVDTPSQVEIPLPPTRARDVQMEVQKVKEYRERFKIESRTGGVGVGVSVCMFTFHNTLDCITCIEFSDDHTLIAAGTEESYIRVWSMVGEPLHVILSGEKQPTNSRRLIGHSAPVYGLSFSPAIAGSEHVDSALSTRPKLLLSCSSDKTIRLWSLETWSCLVVYKGHEGPVWDVRWGPFGHYFATCGRDKTVRVWGQDHISFLRMMVGHDTSVNKIAWHPNGAYIFSASDLSDKSVRMWAFTTGECVRVFCGHLDFISALACSPSGKILASADCSGTIILWDIITGLPTKRCKGHGKGGIWSLSFSVESTILVSGGADCTVRTWDIEISNDPHKSPEGEVLTSSCQTEGTRANSTSGPSTNSNTVPATGAKRKPKDTTITPDQISAFPTKKTPVYNVKVTRMNLVLASGCYLP